MEDKIVDKEKGVNDYDKKKPAVNKCNYSGL